MVETKSVCFFLNMGKKQSRTEIPAECRPEEVGEEGGGEILLLFLRMKRCLHHCVPLGCMEKVIINQTGFCHA